MYTADGNFYYGAARYELHDDQKARLTELANKHMHELVAEVAFEMKKWSGGHEVILERVSVEITGDGWDVQLEQGDWSEKFAFRQELPVHEAPGT